ncbi:MAG TPA: hypothetical protein ENH84_03570 [Phycisphaerae bacterium]|nr:hypothetical protein [Phycisphaerae bacterium]
MHNRPGRPGQVRRNYCGPCRTRLHYHPSGSRRFRCQRCR